MKAQIASDLHFEHYDRFDKVIGFIELLRSCSNAEIIILPGDIGTKSNLEKILLEFSKRWSHVIYVHGNHEFWGSFMNQIYNMKHSSNVYVLEDSFVEIEGQRFIGSTLWFEHKRQSYEDGFTADFQRIIDSSRIGEINEKSQKYLNFEIQEDDVVITHHLPCFQSIAEPFEKSPVTKFFYCPMEEVICNRKPKFWIHGHTHYSFDYEFERTRIICNPYGYFGYQVNPKFSFCKEIEI